MGALSSRLSGRALNAAGLVALALLAAGLIIFPAFPKTAAGLFLTPTTEVNRTLKGDRLPVGESPALSPRESSSPPARRRTRAQVPLGCDPAFSPISSPLLAHVFRRCTV